ncbi:MAG: glycosyl transferase family 90 [Xanthobacteraceae bacterium]
MELGYVSVQNGAVVEWVPPKNLFHHRWNRWTPTINYIHDYAKNHVGWGGEFFVCVYDGWREYSSYAEEGSRKYVSWRDVEHDKFLGFGIANEPRFRHRHDDITIYPEMPRKVLAYNRHLNDRNAILIPDSEFIITRFASYLQQVKNGDIPWGQKASKLVWRGSPLSFNGNAFYGYESNSRRQRDVAVSLSSKPEYRDVIDASYTPTPIPWMLRHKYMLDIDGTVNAWSALWWKMSSNSLVWKLKTHWQQWYYDMLIPYQHYVPLSDFSQIREVFDWCEHNQPTCLAIVKEAKQLMQKLTYEFAISEYEVASIPSISRDNFS